MKISFYRSLPPPLRKLARSAYSLLPAGIRMGRNYWSFREFLSTVDRWDRARVDAWQLEHLKRALEHAATNVPGYHLLFRDAGVQVKDLQSLSDLTHFPFTTKELIRDNLKDFTARNVPEWKRLHRATAGSTGIPFGFYLTQEDIEREMAFIHHAWSEVGWTLGDKSAILRGAFIGSKNDLWEYDPFLRDLHLSSYRLTRESYPRYRDRMRSDRILHLQAYPSMAVQLADMILERGDAEVLPFRLLLLGSENLYEWQVDHIQRAFPSSRIFSWYGHAEQVLFAPMCAQSTRLHLNPVYGYSEILDDAGTPVGVGDTGELIGTSFWNQATPFIRYRTVDHATLGATGCDGCGREFQTLERIDGRLQEMILTETGRYLSMTQINMHSDVFGNVEQFQFHQRERGVVTFRVVKKPSFGDVDTENIRIELEKKLGEDVKLKMEFVERLAPLPSGKFSFLDQELSLKYGDHEIRN